MMNFITYLLLLCISLAHPNFAYSQQQQEEQQEQKEDMQESEDPEDSDTLQAQQEAEAEELEVAGAPVVRRFHQVLNELLAEFGYDVKQGQIKSLKNVAIRKVTVSDTLPLSYRNYVELLVAERIRENSEIRIISCVTCKNKTSRVV